MGEQPVAEMSDSFAHNIEIQSTLKVGLRFNPDINPGLSNSENLFVPNLKDDSNHAIAAYPPQT